MTALLLSLQLLSFIGLILLIKRILKISIYYCPIVVISSIFVILLFCGYVNLLYQVSCVIYALGIISLLFLLKELKNKRILIAILSFVLFIFFMYIFKLRYLTLTQYDDFVVWGSRVKAMLLDNKLPDYDDITFIPAISYKEATGLWIYYFCRFIKNYESLYLLAHQIINFSCLFSLIPLVKDKNPYKIAILCIFSVYMLTANNVFSSLYVDGIISLVCISGISIVLEEKNNIEFTLMTVLVFLSNVKKNAIYFVFIVIAFYFVFNKDISYKKKILNIILFFVLPIFIVSKSFNIYIQSIYPVQTSSVSQPDSSFSIVNSFIPKNKTIDQCMTIVKNIFIYSFNIQFNKSVGLVPLLVSALLILIFSLKNIKECIKAEIVLFLVYIGYIICAIYAYFMIFSLEEALVLAGFERYLWTAIQVSIGISVIYCLKSRDVDYRKCFISIILLAVLLINNHEIASLRPQFSYPSSLTDREKFKKMLEDIEPDKDNYFLIIDTQWLKNGYKMDKRSTNFTWESVIYDLWSGDFEVIKNRDEIMNSLEQWTDIYDYLIIDTPTYETNVYLDSIGRSDLNWQEYVLIEPYNN